MRFISNTNNSIAHSVRTYPHIITYKKNSPSENTWVKHMM